MITLAQNTKYRKTLSEYGENILHYVSNVISIGYFAKSVTDSKIP